MAFHPEAVASSPADVVLFSPTPPPSLSLFTSSAFELLPVEDYNSSSVASSPFNLTTSDADVTPSDPGLPQEQQSVLIALYTVTTALAVAGNIVVIVVLSVGRKSRTDLRAFLLNLAVADLTMAVFCMPFTFTTTMMHDWIFGATMCTVVLFAQVMSVTASVGTSTVIAIDRYLVVARPLKPRGSRRCRLAAVWAVAAILSSVQLVVGRSHTIEFQPGVPLTVCEEAWPEPGGDTWRTSYTFFVLLTTYLLPLGAIAPAYACVARRLWRRRAPGNADTVRDLYQLQSKRRVIKMLIVVVALFAVCWLPLHTFIIILDFVPWLRNEDQPEASGIVIAVYTTVHWLAMSNSFVNPIVYGFMNDSFRFDLRWLVTRCCRRSGRLLGCLPDGSPLNYRDDWESVRGGSFLGGSFRGGGSTASAGGTGGGRTARSTIRGGRLAAPDQPPGAADSRLLRLPRRATVAVDAERCRSWRSPRTANQSDVAEESSKRKNKNKTSKNASLSPPGMCRHETIEFYCQSSLTDCEAYSSNGPTISLTDCRLSSDLVAEINGSAGPVVLTPPPAGART